MPFSLHDVFSFIFSKNWFLCLQRLMSKDIKGQVTHFSYLENFTNSDWWIPKRREVLSPRLWACSSSWSNRKILWVVSHSSSSMQSLFFHALNVNFVFFHQTPIETSGGVRHVYHNPRIACRFRPEFLDRFHKYSLWFFKTEYFFEVTSHLRSPLSRPLTPDAPQENILICTHDPKHLKFAQDIDRAAEFLEKVSCRELENPNDFEWHFIRTNIGVCLQCCKVSDRAI